MIKDFFFIIKMIGLTILVVMVMQFKIGEKTIEQDFHSWIQNSIFVDYVQTAISGGVTLTKVGYKKMHVVVTAALNKMSNHKDKDGVRGISMNLKRYNDKENEEDDSALPHSKLNPNHKIK